MVLLLDILYDGHHQTYNTLTFRAISFFRSPYQYTGSISSIVTLYTLYPYVSFVISQFRTVTLERHYHWWSLSRSPTKPN